MAGQNDFLIFDENKDNMLTQELYSVDEDRTDGFKKGLARSNVNNKVLHQTSKMCSAIGELIKGYDGTATDGGTLTELVDNINGLFIFKPYVKSANFKKGVYVVGTVNENIYIAKSLIDNNTGHDLTDKQYWEEVNLDSYLLNLKADNDFSNVTAPVKDFIDMVISWVIPDWAGGFAIPTSYTTPSAGLVVASFTAVVNINPSLEINGYNNVWYDYSYNGSMRVVVGKGDNLVFSNTANRYFYPLKGVK